MATKRPRSAKAAKKIQTETYNHPEAELLLRPEVGTQAQFRKKKPPKTYRYDSSLSPALDWDGQNSARNLGDWLVAMIEQASQLEPPHTFKDPQQLKNSSDTVIATVTGLQDAIEQLKRIAQPFLNWAGKAERLSFDVPTLPLFVHERLSTKAILETLKGHKRDRQFSMFDLFGTSEHSVSDQVLRAYEHKDNWTNRMMLGDSLVVMNSLLQYESLGRQVQMIYMDPPYGVKFGSNFQPFVRKRQVKHNDDADMTREPEMVQAYRDTWELGLHSYLTYLRDRLLLCRDLLAPSGSVFVQISDENVHHVRELMVEVFGSSNFITTIIFQKTSSEEGEGLSNTSDYLLWACKDKERLRTFPLYREKRPGEIGAKQYVYARSSDNSVIRKMTPEELAKPELLPPGWKVCRKGYPLTSQDYSETRTVDFEFEGKLYGPGRNRHWSVSPDKGLPTLVSKGRIYSTDNSISGIMYLEDMPGTAIGNVWTDTGTGSFTDEQMYVVQTSEKVLERCILMTTEPGDLILDPTCGSGTTAYVAEKLGRRWITADTSRVPLALARQRLLVATFPYFRLKDESRGPVGGFNFQSSEESTNRKADGYGIAAQHTLGSIAGDEPASEIIFRENPERDYSVLRISGPFCFEATIPTPIDWEGGGVEESGTAGDYSDFVARMLEVLRRSPVLRLDGGKTIMLKNVRPPAKTLSLSAEAAVDATTPGQSATIADAFAEANEKNKQMLPVSQKLVALVFGPENGAISEKLVFEAAKEASGKNYSHLYVIGFAIQPNARKLIEDCEAAMSIAATYIQATPDLMMGDLLKNMRSSQIFSVCGLPEIRVSRQEAKDAKKESNSQMYQVELVGLDVFDPATMETMHRGGNDVPAWFLDTDYNGLVFHVSQAFFPRTSAWDDLKRTLKNEFEESVWEHLAGTTSAPFEAGDNAQVAVKVIDDRGNELLVVKSLKEAK